jgi:hypothetical protein
MSDKKIWILQACVLPSEGPKTFTTWTPRTDCILGPIPDYHYTKASSWFDARQVLARATEINVVNENGMYLRVVTAESAGVKPAEIRRLDRLYERTINPKGNGAKARERCKECGRPKSTGAKTPRASRVGKDKAGR